jgi:PPOX class probable F420-dependent enzyme
MASPLLSPAERRFVEAARRAVLATVDPNGLPRLVPICFAVEPGETDRDPLVIWTPLDDKPKASGAPLELARVRDILDRPGVTVLVDRWSEAWDELGWIRLRGSAALAAADHPSHRAMVAALRARYPQYETHALEDRPMIRIVVDAVSGWGNLEGPPRE